MLPTLYLMTTQMEKELAQIQGMFSREIQLAPPALGEVLQTMFNLS